MWRNWQTRRFQVPVGDHMGSSPFIRTKKISCEGKRFFLSKPRGLAYHQAERLYIITAQAVYNFHCGLMICNSYELMICTILYRDDMHNFVVIVWSQKRLQVRPRWPSKPMRVCAVFLVRKDLNLHIAVIRRRSASTASAKLSISPPRLAGWANIFWRNLWALTRTQCARVSA